MTLETLIKKIDKIVNKPIGAHTKVTEIVWEMVQKDRDKYNAIIGILKEDIILMGNKSNHDVTCKSN